MVSNIKKSIDRPRKKKNSIKSNKSGKGKTNKKRIKRGYK